MNLIIVPPESVRDGVAELGERARRHVESVLGKRPGDVVRIGVRGGRCFLGTIASLAPVALVELGAEVAAPPPSPVVHLLVALPRPKSVSRLVQTAASLRATTLTFIDGWKVEKSYFDSPRLDPARLAEDALLGAEQGGHTDVPVIRATRGFRRFLEDEFPMMAAPDAERFLFDPGGATDLLRAVTGSPLEGPFFFAFGPEGGFIDSERRSFESAGFREISLRTPILTTEIAVATALGQLALLAAR